jgi:hypothetical protein
VAKSKKATTAKNASAPNVDYEAGLWRMADALRGSMDAAEYKHVVLDLTFSSTSRTRSRRNTRSSKPNERRAPTRRTRMSTGHATSSGCRRRPAGRISGNRLGSPRSVNLSTRRWRASSATTPRDKAGRGR